MRKIKVYLMLLSVVVLCMGLIGCSRVAATESVAERLIVEEYVDNRIVREQESEAIEDARQAAIAVGDVKVVNLVAVGDNLIHTGIYKSGLQADGSYNFDHLYTHIKEDIQAADLAIVNQETIYTYNRDSYSGYPCFGSPVEIGDALVEIGFDVVQHATNHVYDQGKQGILDTLDFWKTKHPEIAVLGIHESQEAADTIQTVESNGITFAMLNYTYGMNGFVLPDDMPYLVNILDKQQVAADIARAREVSDCVIFFLHVGDEYTYQPSDYTKEWVNFLAENGVDITIASHPHVLEPYKEVVSSSGHKMVTYYSMGNLISTQDQYPRLIGGIAKMTIQMIGSGENAVVEVTDYTMDPLFTHYNHTTGVYTVYKLDDYTDELASQHQLYSTTSPALTVDLIRNTYNEIMATEVTD